MPWATGVCLSVCPDCLCYTAYASVPIACVIRHMLKVSRQKAAVASFLLSDLRVMD